MKLGTPSDVDETWHNFGFDEARYDFVGPFVVFRCWVVFLFVVCLLNVYFCFRVLPLLVSVFVLSVPMFLLLFGVPLVVWVICAGDVVW